MQRPSLTVVIPDFTFVPSESFLLEQDSRRLRQQRSAARAIYLRSIQERGSARAFSSRSRQPQQPGARRLFFSRSRMGALRALLWRSRQQEPREPDGVDWDERAGYLFTVPASTEAIMGLRVPAAGETRELGCAVCLEDFEVGDELRRMPCSHSFHERCIFLWLRINRACPCCRLPLLSVENELDE